LQKVANIFAAVAGPGIALYLGFLFDDSLKARDARLRTTELAIAVLREDPQNAPETPSLRAWAVDVINKFSGVPFPEGVKEELQKSPLVAQDRRTFKDRLVSHIDYLWEELEQRGVDGSALGCGSMLEPNGLSRYSSLVNSPNEENNRTVNLLIDLRAACRHLHDMS
jgi:hypothetical protein